MDKEAPQDSVDVSAYPLIVFVHVPKTAGTTIKEVLRLCTPRGNGNIRNILENRRQFLDIARKSDWISGHFTRETFASGLIWLDRTVEYFSAVRDPVDQLVSHLNFSMHRTNDKRHYDLLEENEKAIDAEIASIDFRDPNEIIDFLSRHASTYLNIQSKFIVGEDYDCITDEELIFRLQTYRYIANEFTLENLYKLFGFSKLPNDYRAIRENTANQYIQRAIFESPRLRDFLFYHHRHDSQLYAAAMQIALREKECRAFRPALLATEPVTYENFDEAAYLASNPDVADAVRSGAAESGFAHFSAIGAAERRMYRRWALAP